MATPLSPTSGYLGKHLTRLSTPGETERQLKMKEVNSHSNLVRAPSKTRSLLMVARRTGFQNHCRLKPPVRTKKSNALCREQEEGPSDKKGESKIYNPLSMGRAYLVIGPQYDWFNRPHKYSALPCITSMALFSIKN